jgi:hypothetical protein
MDAHPLVAGVEAGTQNLDDHARAREDAEQIERLVVEALGIADATESSRLRFGDLVQQIERLIGPWRVNHPVAILVSWHEYVVRRRLYTHAVTRFGRAGEMLAPRPLDPIPHAAARGAPNFFRL